MVNVGIVVFSIGIMVTPFFVAIFFVVYFIRKEYANENSHSAKLLDGLDRVYREPSKKVKSLETQQIKVKSFQMELVETEPIQQCVIQAFKGVSEE